MAVSFLTHYYGTSTTSTVTAARIAFRQSSNTGKWRHNQQSVNVLGSNEVIKSKHSKRLPISLRRNDVPVRYFSSEVLRTSYREKQAQVQNLVPNKEVRNGALPLSLMVGAVAASFLFSSLSDENSTSTMKLETLLASPVVPKTSRIHVSSPKMSSKDSIISTHLPDAIDKTKSKTSTTTLSTAAISPVNEIQEISLDRNYNVSVRALRGGRLYMEDEFYVAKNGHFAAIFDGHGGNAVSRYLKENLYKKFSSLLNKNLITQDKKQVKANENFWRSKSLDVFEGDEENLSIAIGYNSIINHISALRDAISDIDKEVLNDSKLRDQGSTAVAVSIHEDLESRQRTILSANVGDSRAILSRRKKAINLTRDHKPNEEKERARIIAMGENIEWDPMAHVYRVRNLSLSRAIGDYFAKPAISGEAEIKQFPLSEEGDEFIVLASDGLWDVMTSKEVVSFVHRRLEAPHHPKKNSNSSAASFDKVKEERRRLMSRYIAHEALLRGSADNICIVIIWLKDD